MTRDGRPNWAKAKDKRKRRPVILPEDRRARERAEAAYRAAQGVVWRVVEVSR